MKEIPIKKYVRYLFGIAALIFILNKLFLRPWILENDTPELLIIATNSIPNFIEAIIGTLLTTGILLQARQYFNQNLNSIKVIYIQIIAVCMASIYVISQELKIHNWGGNNVYDPYDVIASILGLLGTFLIIQIFGFIDEIEIDSKNNTQKL